MVAIGTRQAVWIAAALVVWLSAAASAQTISGAAGRPVARQPGPTWNQPQQNRLQLVQATEDVDEYEQESDLDRAPLRLAGARGADELAQDDGAAAEVLRSGQPNETSEGPGIDLSAPPDEAPAGGIRLPSEGPLAGAAEGAAAEGGEDVLKELEKEPVRGRQRRPPAESTERKDREQQEEAGPPQPPTWQEMLYSEWVEDEPAFLKTTGSWFNSGDLYFQADFTYFHRSTENNVRISTDFSTSLPGNALSNRLFVNDGQGYAPGGRFTVGWLAGRDDKNRDHALEFTYTGLNQWKDEAGITAVNPNATNQLGLTLGVDPTGAGGVFENATTHQYTYLSDFNSFEANLRITRRLGRDKMVLECGDWVRRCEPGWLPSVIFGFRALSVDDQFDFRSQGIAAGRSGRFHLDTHNDLVGLQSGLDLVYHTCGWRAGVRGKIGGYVNFLDQQTSVTQTESGTTTFTRREADNDTAALEGEISLMAAYYLRPNLAARVSYDFIWINTLALAPEQISFTPVTRVFDGGALRMEGATIGIEWIW